MKKYLVLACIGITFLSCSSDDAFSDGIVVLYNQTYCADPWGYADTNNELANKISNYFKAVNIEISDILIDDKGTPQLCNACICLSGKRFIIMVREQDLDAIQEYRFEVVD